MAAYRLAVVCDRLKTRARCRGRARYRILSGDPGESSQILRTGILRSRLLAWLLRKCRAAEDQPGTAPENAAQLARGCHPKGRPGGQAGTGPADRAASPWRSGSQVMAQCKLGRPARFRGAAAMVLHYPTSICRRLPVLTSRLTSCQQRQPGGVVLPQAAAPRSISRPG